VLYGAYGYTGGLVARRAVELGRPPIVAGRDEARVRARAGELDLPARVFALDDRTALDAALADVAAVVLVAGPFSATSAPVVDACLRAGVHYLDVTGEIDVFSACEARDDAARAAGCVLMPGVGFDVVASDCLAAALHEALPDATRLALAVRALSRTSRGTARSMIEMAGHGGLRRAGGLLVPARVGTRRPAVPFGPRAWPAISVPLADLVSAFHTTRIPDIETFAAVPPRLARVVAALAPAAPLMRSRLLQRIAKAWVDLRAPGPSAAQLERGSGQVWGRVENAAGDVVSGWVRTPDPYRFTADSVLQCLSGVLDGRAAPGFRAPAEAFGSDLILRCEGCELRVERGERAGGDSAGVR
jgi:short subunit dehydrogenase-like uncharacterized protein